MAARPFEFNGVVRLTRVGAAYVVFTVLLGVSAINTGNNSIYIGLTFMLGGLILSGVASKSGLRHLEVEVIAPDETWAAKPATGMLRVTNRSRIWSVRDVVITAPELHAPVFVSAIRRRETMNIEAEFSFPRRGRVEFQRAALYTRYPFGLFLKKRTVKVNGEAIVFPKLLEETETSRPVGRSENGAIETHRAGPGSELLGFREYVRGDSLRQVHWKKSASLGRWIMKQPELDAAHVVRIAVDPMMPHDATPEQFEMMISRATTFLVESLRRDLHVELHVPGRVLRGTGPRTRRVMLETLALLEPSVEAPTRLFDQGMAIFSLRRLHEPQIA
jgi:uncharacterized protein (DUF58 family)